MLMLSGPVINLQSQCSEISTYEKIHFEMKNVQNALGILLKTILKIRNSHFYENFNSIYYRILKVILRHCSGFLGKEKIENTF